MGWLHWCGKRSMRRGCVEFVGAALSRLRRRVNKAAQAALLFSCYIRPMASNAPPAWLTHCFHFRVTNAFCSPFRLEVAVLPMPIKNTLQPASRSGRLGLESNKSFDKAEHPQGKFPEDTKNPGTVQ